LCFYFPSACQKAIFSMQTLFAPRAGAVKPPSAFSTVNLLSTAFYIGVQGA
jgi:hypothetical protein